MSSLVPVQPPGEAIPRHLFQIFLGGPLPTELESNVARLRALNEGWTYQLLDDRAAETFIASHYPPPILALFRRLSPEYQAARADLLRYLLIYRFGGVYLDVKSGATRPFSEVLRREDRFILSQWRNAPGEPHGGWGLHAELADEARGEFQQWHVIAAPGHPFLHAVLERVLTNIRDYRVQTDETGWLGVLRLTGPIAYSRAILPLIGSAPCRRITDETDLGLIYNVLGGSSHKRLSKRHYTMAVSPVVRRRAPLRWWDHTYLAARTWKRRRPGRSAST